MPFDARPAAIAPGSDAAMTLHRPVMLDEALTGLDVRAGGIYVDCTFGRGGHSAAILDALCGQGALHALDQDPEAVAHARERFARSDFHIHHANFSQHASIAEVAGIAGRIDGILMDLGVSSPQLDDASRGFSFSRSGPLDMRMNPARGLSASQLLSKLNNAELTRLLTENSDEPRATELSEAILTAHARKPLTTTHDLADVIRDAFSRIRLISTETAEGAVRRVFQALRIAVNDEFGALDMFLRNLPFCLKPGGRVAILTFHSGEDRRVKIAFKNGLRDGLFASISEEVTRASMDEQRSNPRSASAKLRVAVRR